MAETLESFFERSAEKPVAGFTAEPRYSPEGDCIHFHWRDDEFYRDWQDDKLTVYRSIHNDEAVGCQIKGVTALLKKLGDFGISVNEKTGVPFAMFLFASHAAATPCDELLVARERTYKYLLEQIGRKKVEVKLSETVST
jgi:hypothetical protein